MDVSVGSQDALFFTGGPIGAMDWVPVPNDHHQQYLALAAYKTVDEVGVVWRLPSNQSTTGTLSL